jgi:hypothetical protein
MVFKLILNNIALDIVEKLIIILILLLFIKDLKVIKDIIIPWREEDRNVNGFILMIILLKKYNKVMS